MNCELGNKLGDKLLGKIKEGEKRDIASTKVFCILCFLFSSKIQDVNTDYFTCISVQFLLSKEPVLHFYNVLFCFVSSFDSEFGLYFSALYGIVFLACLLVETHELEVTVHRHTKITVTEQLQY